MCEHIEKRTGQLTALQRGDQIGFVHHFTARHVDELRAGRQQRQRAAVDQPTRHVGQWARKDQPVGQRQHLLQPLEANDLMHTINPQRAAPDVDGAQTQGRQQPSDVLAN